MILIRSTINYLVAVIKRIRFQINRRSLSYSLRNRKGLRSGINSWCNTSLLRTRTISLLPECQNPSASKRSNTSLWFSSIARPRALFSTCTRLNLLPAALIAAFQNRKRRSSSISFLAEVLILRASWSLMRSFGRILLSLEMSKRLEGLQSMSSQYFSFYSTLCLQCICQGSQDL